MTGLGTSELQADAVAVPSAAPSQRRRLVRRAGTILIVVGFLFLVYGATVYFWRDPITDLYSRVKQHQLAGDLDRGFAEYRSKAFAGPGSDAGTVGESSGTAQPGAQTAQPGGEASTSADTGSRLSALAREYYAGLEEGQPLGRLRIPRLGIDPIVVNGTRWGSDLSRGPGRYAETWLPGLSKVTAIAGHRTTFGAPFRHIDRLMPGDVITLELAYGTFDYRVIGHEIVDDEDWSIIRDRGFDALVLSACHPLYGASQRWIVYARLEAAVLPDGTAYRPPDPNSS